LRLAVARQAVLRVYARVEPDNEEALVPMTREDDDGHDDGTEGQSEIASGAGARTVRSPWMEFWMCQVPLNPGKIPSLLFLLACPKRMGTQGLFLTSARQIGM
jgi:hypothetical protein